MNTQAQRGYTLVIVMVLLAVLLVLGTSAIRVATSEAEAASGNRRQMALRSCAQAAREVMISHLRYMQPMPESFSAQVLDSNGKPMVDINQGHDPSAPAPPALIKDVQFVNDAVMGAGKSAALHPQITNDILPPGAQGAASGRVVAHCRDAAGRVHEVEFMVRYGF